MQAKTVGERIKYLRDQNHMTQKALSECDIEVTGTAESSVYGIDTISSHCTGSRFKAVGSLALAGNTGGNFTECVFDGFGEKKGYGFYVHSSFHANNCTFRGYTKSLNLEVAVRQMPIPKKKQILCLKEKLI